MVRKISALLLLLGLCACTTPQRVAPPSPAAAASPPAAVVPIPPAPPRQQPNQFSNMSVTQLRALLGVPAFVRKEGATEMWRYDTPSCHAFFFLNGSGAQQQVGYIQTLPVGKDQAADPACLNALRKTS